MSNLVPKNELREKLPDATSTEIERLADFIKNNLHKMPNVSEEIIHKMEQAYVIEGHSYSSLCSIFGLKKPVVMFIAMQRSFHFKKTEKNEDYRRDLKNKIETTAQLASETVIAGVTSYSIYFKDIFDRYTRTRNPQILETMDIKMLNTYLKILKDNPELIGKNDGKTPMMGLSLPNGGTLRKINDNEIEVIPNDGQAAVSSHSDMLNMIAQLKREREALEAEKSSVILRKK